MIRKVVMIVLWSVWTVRELYEFCIVIGLTYMQDGDELTQIKAEEVTYIQEEDPLAVTVPAMKAEQEVSCISVWPAFTDMHLFIIYEGRTESHEQLFFCMRTGNSRRRRVRW